MMLLTRSNDVVNRHHMAVHMHYFCSSSSASQQATVI